MRFFYSCALFVFIVTILGVFPQAQGAPVTFNDTALLNAVKTQWEAATGLTLSNPPQDTELSNPLFTRLEARNLGIIDLTGLQACTALTNLNLGKNQISNVSPLSGLTNLVKLDIGLGVNPLEADEEFGYWLSQGNTITDLSPLAGLVNLEYLSLMGNYFLTNIAVLSALDSLDFLWMGSSPIADFSPLLDTAETLSGLGIINCGMENADIPIINALTNLGMLGIMVEPALTDISGLTGISLGLVFLGLIDIGATDISVISNYTDLEALYLMSNTLTSLPNLSGLVHLHTLLANESSFTDISGVNGLTSLRTLELTKNNISDIGPLETCTGLKYIGLRENQITDIQPLLDNAGIGWLQSLDIQDNPFYSGTPFCEENQLDQLIALAPSAQIEQNATCMVPVTLTITVTGIGATAPGAGTNIVGLGEWVNLTAVPVSGSGWAFDHWAGDASGTNESLFFIMDGDKTVEAVFVPGDHILTILHAGAGSGDTRLAPGVYSFLDGRETWLSAYPNSGSYFGGWQGDVSGYMPGHQLIMDGDKTATAFFDTSGYNLSLNVSGSGNVSFFQTGATYGFVAGAVLDLNAAPNPGNAFDHWEGDIGGADPDNPNIQITMDQHRSLTAVFTTVPQARLTVNVGGTGSGTTTPVPGVYSFDQGYSTWIQAFPNEGSAFDHWEGDIGSANPCQDTIFITMDQNRAITAVFVPAVWTLTVQKTGNGATSPIPGNYGFVNGVRKWVYANLMDGGDAFDRWTGDLMPWMPAENTVQELTMNQNRTVTAQFVPGDWTLTLATEEPAGNSCLPLYPGVGTYSYLNGRTAEVGVPSSCAERFFAGWTGDASGFYPNLSIPMNGNKSITAHFVATGFSLTTAISGQGGMNLSPGTFYYASGAAFTLTATPWPGWVFDHWEGDVPAGEDPNTSSIDITMDQNRTLTAVMTQLPAHTLTITVLGPGITSPAAGVHEIEAGTTQYITALPNPGAALDHWEGDIGDADPTQTGISVVMDRDRSITVVFTTADWTLTINTSGNGSTYPYPGTYGFLNGVQTCVSQRLVAGGGAFSQWAGDLAPGADPLVGNQCVTMDKNRTLTAEFVPGDWTLTLATTGAGSGNLNPGTGIFSFLDGQRVDVIANTNLGGYFGGWTGDYMGTESYIQLLMDSNKSLTATFATSGHTLTVGMEGQGWLNILPGIYHYAAGTEVTIHPFGELGNWDFDYWSGDLPGGVDPNDPELTVAMDQDRNITAHFVQDLRTLTIIIEGEGVTNPSGSPYPGTVHSFSPGQYVFVGAELGTGDWAFSHWTGDTGSGDPTKWFLELTMDMNRTVVAHFVPAAWHLTVNYTGTGSIYPPAGTYAFGHGAIFEVVANVISGGDAFYEWTGDVPAGMDPHQFDLHLTMDQDRTLTAVFAPGDFTMTLNPITGGGTAELYPSPGTYAYFAGQTAWIEARVTTGHYWGGWSGDINTFDKIYHFVMDGNKVITPHVTTTGYTLTLATAGAPGATAPEGSIKYSAGATPLIHALETGAGFFDHWSGDLPSGMDPANPDPIVLMDRNRALTANFVQADWYLYIQVIGNGTTAPAPDLYWHRNGDTFIVTAIPGGDFRFLQWQGNVPEGQDPAALTISGTITQNVELIAVFVPESVTVPNLSGKTQAEAEAALAVLGLVLGAVTQEYSSTVPAGRVIHQNPAAQTTVAFGSAVSVVISLGSCYTSIPNVTGLALSGAEAAFTAANLVLGTVTHEPSDIVPTGQVISQTPPAGLVVECGTAIDLVVSGTDPTEGAEEGEGEGQEEQWQTADQDHNNQISLSELLRVIQFFNSDGFHCQSGTEDGYAPGPGDQTCANYATDYNPVDWRISLSELLRIIQFFNSGGYHYCPGNATEDGFCPGLT